VVATDDGNDLIPLGIQICFPVEFAGMAEV
jgi:hypothetical protein